MPKKIGIHLGHSLSCTVASGDVSAVTSQYITEELIVWDKASITDGIFHMFHIGKNPLIHLRSSLFYTITRRWFHVSDKLTVWIRQSKENQYSEPSKPAVGLVDGIEEKRNVMVDK